MRYNFKSGSSEKEERPEVKKFLDDLTEVFKEYNMCIGHEDEHGAFIIEHYDEDIINWMRSASLNL